MGVNMGCKGDYWRELHLKAQEALSSPIPILQEHQWFLPLSALYLLLFPMLQASIHPTLARQ